MTVIDNAVKKLFGKNPNNYEVGSVEHMKECIRNGPDVLKKHYDKTPNDIITDFLFEQTDVAKELKRIMEMIHDNPEEKNT